jgi:hypothetical protein
LNPPCLGGALQVAGGRVAGLPAEGNFYFDASQTGIGFHGDSERRVVIAARLGVSIPLRWVTDPDCKLCWSPVVWSQA